MAVAISHEREAIVNLLFEKGCTFETGNAFYPDAEQYALFWGKQTLAELIRQHRNKIELRPYPTMGGGDCGLHALFGKWDSFEQIFVCQDTVFLKKAIAERIKQSTEGNPLFELVKEAVQQIIMGEQVVGEEIGKIKVYYQQYIKENQALMNSTWNIKEGL